MKTLNLLLGVLAIALALAAPPALAGSLMAGAAGLLLLASAGIQSMPAPAQPAPVVQLVRVVAPPDVRVFELADGAGVVVFKTVGGKLTSRCYRA